MQLSDLAILLHNPRGDGLGNLCFSPIADTGSFVWGDIQRIDNAIGHGEGVAAGQTAQILV